MSDWTTRFESPETADAELEAYIARKKAREAQQPTKPATQPCAEPAKPEPKKQWCRMYLVKGVIGNSGECFYSAIALNGHIRELEDVEKNPIFVRWLTDRIEYELPEGDA